MQAAAADPRRGRSWRRPLSRARCATADRRRSAPGPQVLDAFFLNAPAGFAFLDATCATSASTSRWPVMGSQPHEIVGGRALSRGRAHPRATSLEPLLAACSRRASRPGLELANADGRQRSPRQLLPGRPGRTACRHRDRRHRRHAPEGRRAAPRGDEPAAHRPRDDRRADAASEPPHARRAARARARAGPATAASRVAAPLHRPRRLQGRQRLARPRVRRPAAGRGRRAVSAQAPARRTSSPVSAATSSSSCSPTWTPRSAPALCAGGRRPDPRAPREHASRSTPSS